MPKLQPIQIPVFRGNFREWKSFIDLFTNIIHNNRHIVDVIKMQYLLNYVDGDAKRIISHLQLSPQNYHLALQLLQERFNNNRRIITAYINNMLDTKKIEPGSTKDIITLHDTLRECLAALNNMGCCTDHWSPLIITIITRKLDVESLQRFED